MKPFASTWTLDEALALVRMLEPNLADIGWHVALAGGVLLRDKSTHDVDLICYQHDSSKLRMYALREVVLKNLGWRRRGGVLAVHEHWRSLGSTDEKHVEIWATSDGRRVDIISP